jgi:hypothetical protein
VARTRVMEMGKIGSCAHASSESWPWGEGGQVEGGRERLMALSDSPGCGGGERPVLDLESRQAYVLAGALQRGRTGWCFAGPAPTSAGSAVPDSHPRFTQLESDLRPTRDVAWRAQA